jgi:hypothetical protein
MSQYSPTPSELEQVRDMRGLLHEVDQSEFMRIVNDNPWMAKTRIPGGGSLLFEAIRVSTPELIDFLIQKGSDVNVVNGSCTTVLSYACSYGKLEAVKLLLKHGADPKRDRELISAINADEHSFELVKLLVEYGADVNQIWVWETADPTFEFNACWFADISDQQDIVDFLKAKGATRLPTTEQDAVRIGRANFTERKRAILKFFRQQYGPIKELSVQENIPTDPEITLHLIAPNEKQRNYVLFTTGMSTLPQKTPTGYEEYQYTELAIFLPGDWPFSKKILSDPQYSWMFQWLRKIACYPHLHKTWLGGPIAVISNEHPPKPLAPGMPMTSLLLLANLEDCGPIAVPEDKEIQIYTVIPLFTEEMQLEKKQGIGALMQLFDLYKVTKVVDAKRSNVVKR